MKFLHLADLHIGKHLENIPLFEDQRYVLNQAVALAKDENVDCILLCGDIYDSAMPSSEATKLYDDFLTSLYHLGKPILIISGNHDSSERLGLASAILSNDGIYIQTDVADINKPIVIGDTNFYLLPYFRPSEVAYAFNKEVRTYEEAFGILLEAMNIDQNKQNVLLLHQAMLPKGTTILASGSESALDLKPDYSIGGSEVIDVSLTSSFDYVALGHIHKAQNVAPNARYPGALLKYFKDEAKAKRSFTIVTIENKKLTIQERPVKPLHELSVLEGTMDEVLAMDGHENDYVYVNLREEDYIQDASAKIKAKYPYFVKLQFKSIKQGNIETPEFEDVESVSKDDLFSAFFQKYAGRELEEEEKTFIHSLLQEEMQ